MRNGPKRNKGPKGNSPQRPTAYPHLARSCAPDDQWNPFTDPGQLLCRNVQFVKSLAGNQAPHQQQCKHGASDNLAARGDDEIRVHSLTRFAAK
jgi:hypothetical protein